VRHHPARAALFVTLTWITACGSSRETTPIPAPPLTGVELEVAQAIAAARAEVEHDPASSAAWSKLADYLMAHDFKAEAALCYARAEELDPKSYLLPYRLGWALLAEDPEGAAQAFERTLRSLDSYAPLHCAYARALARLGRDEEALSHYRRAGELDPKSAEPEAGLGLLFVARGDFPAARAHLEAALERKPTHVEAHSAMAQVALALGQPKKAELHAERARTLPQTRREADAYASPNVPPLGARARTRHGRDLESYGRQEDAVEQYRAALASNPNYYLARRSLASLLLARGQRDEALALLREAERAQPAFEEVRRDIARMESGKPIEREGGD
jgi:tetratricopeptide (TPR) repeat protein